VAADAVLSRELKSLQEELATGRQRPAQPAAKAEQPAAATDTGVGTSVVADSAASAGPQPESPAEQELRNQFRDLVKEITDFVDDAEKNISAHPAMSIVAAMLLGIIIGSLLARR
jgi:hypothetical protein